MNIQLKASFWAVCFTNLLPLAIAFAEPTPVQQSISAIVSQSPTHEEKIVVNNITPSNSGETINDVRVRFADSTVEVPLRNMGSGTWEGSLSPDQVAALTPEGTDSVHLATISVLPTSYAAGALKPLQKQVQITVQPLG